MDEWEVEQKLNHLLRSFSLSMLKDVKIHNEFSAFNFK